MSTSRVTSPCHSSILVGRSSITVVTRLVFLLVDLAFSKPILVPKMSSACTMLAYVMGQYGIIFLSLYIIKSARLGWPIISCKECTNLDLLLYTVLVKMCLTSSLTSEKNSPFRGSKYLGGTICFNY